MESRLKLFANVVDAGSFTLAAQQLRVSQPALSSSVKKLERELGASLLDRSSFALTDAGRAAYRAGKQLHTSEFNLQTELAEIAGRKPTLRIGMIDSLADLVFVQAGAYSEIARSASLALTIDSSSRLIEQLRAGNIDIAFVVAGDEYPADVVVHQKLGDEPLLLVAAPSRQRLAREASRTGTLEAFLSYNAGSNTQRLVQRAAAQSGLALSTRFYATSPNIMLAMALKGQGVAALPFHMVDKHLASGELLPIALNGRHVIKRPMLALVRRGRKLPAAADLAAQTAQQSLQSLMVRAKSSI